MPLGCFHDFNRSKETLFIVSAGAAGEIGYSDMPFWAADDVWTLKSSAFLQRYMYFVLLSKQSRIKSCVRKASVPRLSKNVVETLEFILPPRHKQQQIVDKLDKFDTLTNDTTNGLQKEIELRQKAYEYWCEKLLSF